MSDVSYASANDFRLTKDPPTMLGRALIHGEIVPALRNARTYFSSFEVTSIEG